MVVVQFESETNFLYSSLTFGQDSNKRLLRWRDFGVGLCREPCASTEDERADQQAPQLETEVHRRRSPSESQIFQDELHFLTPWMRVDLRDRREHDADPRFFKWDRPENKQEDGSHPEAPGAGNPVLLRM